MASYLACTTSGICAFLTASGPFLGPTKITSAFIATVLTGEGFLIATPIINSCNYLSKKGLFQKDEAAYTITAIALHIIVASSFLWGGMHGASDALALTSFSLEPFSPGQAFASTAVTTVLVFLNLLSEKDD